MVALHLGLIINLDMMRKLNFQDYAMWLKEIKNNFRVINNPLYNLRIQ